VTLVAGTRVGPYEVQAPLGAGGMGEVYRAHDTKLARDVALKILPDDFSHDPARLGRFQREAQVLAALNHPHVAQIYGFEEQSDVASGFSRTIRALVMELVEGPTLADVIERRAGASEPAGLPLDEALPIARQIVEALEAAHEQGIVHRDLRVQHPREPEDRLVGFFRDDPQLGCEFVVGPRAPRGAVIRGGRCGRILVLGSQRRTRGMSGSPCTNRMDKSANASVRVCSSSA
jgi:serine/threonine protein kinase